MVEQTVGFLGSMSDTHTGVWVRLHIGKGTDCGGFSVVHSTPACEEDTTDGSAPLVLSSPRLFPILDPLMHPSLIPGSSGTFSFSLPHHSYATIVATFTSLSVTCPPLFFSSVFTCLNITIITSFPLLRNLRRLLTALCAKSDLIRLYTSTHFSLLSSISSISSSGLP